MYIEARKWIRQTFAQGSRPPMRKVEQWVKDGDVPGRYFGADLYIADSFATVERDAVKPPRGKLDLLG